MPVNVGAVRVPQNGGRVMVTAYGTTAGGAFDSGVQFMDAMDYPRIHFQLLGTFTGMSAQFFGCSDPLLYQFYLANIGTWQGAQLGATAGIPQPVTVPPATSWYQLGAPSDQSGTTGPVNPLTAAQQYLETRQPWLAVRCVVTAAALSTGTCVAVGQATV